MPNPFRRVREFFRKPAMIGTPPSQRPMWPDPAAHARDFALQYATELDYAVSQRMMDLGIPDDQIGTNNVGHGPPRLAFQPHGVEGGHIFGNGEILIDSAVLNDDLLEAGDGKRASRLFGRSRLRDRVDAVVAHEFEEYRHGMDHEAAVKRSPVTELPISRRAREILREMSKGWGER